MEKAGTGQATTNQVEVENDRLIFCIYGKNSQEVSYFTSYLEVDALIVQVREENIRRVSIM